MCRTNNMSLFQPSTTTFFTWAWAGNGQMGSESSQRRPLTVISYNFQLLCTITKRRRHGRHPSLGNTGPQKGSITCTRNRYLLYTSHNNSTTHRQLTNKRDQHTRCFLCHRHTICSQFAILHTFQRTRQAITNAHIAKH